MKRVKVSATTLKAGYQNRGKFVYCTLLRMQWCGGPPGAREWADTNFYLSEALRKQYDAQSIVFLDFRPIPECDDEYVVTAEVTVSQEPKLHPIRVAPRKPVRSGSIKEDADGNLILELRPDPLWDLTEADRQLFFRFNRLSVESRLRIWQNSLARYFDAADRHSRVSP